MTKVEDVRRYLLAGDATVTIRSVRTNKHFTWRLRTPGRPGAALLFCSLRTNGDDGNWEYRGIVNSGHIFVPKRPIDDERLMADNALRFLLRCTFKEDVIPPSLEIKHDGRCGKCGLKLTNPVSIERGFGPECWASVESSGQR